MGRRKEELERITDSILSGRIIPSSSGIDFSGLEKDEREFVINALIDVRIERGITSIYFYRILQEDADIIGRTFSDDESYQIASQILGSAFKEGRKMHPNDLERGMEGVQEIMQRLNEDARNSLLEIVRKIYLKRLEESKFLDFEGWGTVPDFDEGTLYEFKTAIEYFRQLEPQDKRSLRRVAKIALEGSEEEIIGRTLESRILRSLDIGYDLVFEAYDGSATPTDYSNLAKLLLQTHPQIDNWRKLKGVPDVNPTITYVKDERFGRPTRLLDGEKIGIPNRNQEFYDCDSSGSIITGLDEPRVFRDRYTLLKDKFIDYLDRIEEARSEKGMDAIELVTDPQILDKTIGALEESERFKGVDLTHAKRNYFGMTGSPEFGEFISQFAS